MQRTKWALGLVMLVFGLLITTQMRVQQQVPKDPSRLRAEDLAQELKATQEKLAAAEKQRDQYSADLDKLRKAGSGGATVTVPQRDIPQEILAGSSDVVGPGAVITLVESPEAGAKARVRDEDIWSVVNELLAGGSEAISINGQRLTAVTGIRNVGQRVGIGRTIMSSPFEIAAIGDPAVLEAALRLRGGVVDTLQRWGIKVTIVRSDNVKIPANKTTPVFQYAKPAH